MTMDLKTLIMKSAPFAEIQQDGPARPGGAYVLDVTWKDRHVVVQFSPRHGYGISASDEIGLGVGPDEVHKTAQEAAERVVDLLQSGADTCPHRLREVREARGVTQAQLAAILGVGQAAVSKVENRSEVTLTSLRRFIGALGGRLSIMAEFPDGSFPILDEPIPAGTGAVQLPLASDGGVVAPSARRS